ncbi:hypothetical protein BV20DRAFT_949968, partial [Pilatotrama ljubarskyi]
RPRSVLSHIGQEVSFAHGLLAGRTVRVELEELQKADLGRKYARKDKRPLDPPPVVACRFFEVTRTNHSAPPFERELEPEQAQTLGTFCHVDLFPVPEEFCPGGAPRQSDGPSSSTLPRSSLQQFPGPSYPSSHQPFSPPVNLPPLVLNAASTAPPNIGDPDVVAWLGTFPIRESSKCTAMLSGGTFVECPVVDYRGKRTAMFVFPDLAVKMEGTFVLRYRAFTICSQRATGPHMPVLAECYGGPFKVYSTKEFPGLRPSTQLTKFLSLHGVRVNLRENERKRRKKSEMDDDRDSPPPSGSGAGGSSHVGASGIRDARMKSVGRSVGSPSGSSRSPTSPSAHVFRQHTSS